MMELSVYQKCKDAFEMLNVTSWPDVEDRLDDPDSDQVVEALLDYAYANLAVDIIRDEEKAVTRVTHPNKKDRDEELYRLNTRRIVCEKSVKDKIVTLRVLLVGQEAYDAEQARMDAFHAECDALFD